MIRLKIYFKDGNTIEWPYPSTCKITKNDLNNNHALGSLTGKGTKAEFITKEGNRIVEGFEDIAQIE